MACDRLLRASVALLLACLACREDAAPPRVPVAAAVARPEPAPWPRFAEVAAWAPVNEKPVVSRGHLVSPNRARIRVSESSRALYLALVRDSVMPDGTIVAMFHESDDGTRRGPVYVMEKKGGDWSFSALDPAGRPALMAAEVDPQGAATTPELDPGACAGCHADAVADGLFGLPRASVPPGAATEARSE